MLSKLKRKNLSDKKLIKYTFYLGLNSLFKLVSKNDEIDELKLN